MLLEMEMDFKNPFTVITKRPRNKNTSSKKVAGFKWEKLSKLTENIDKIWANGKWYNFLNS